MQTRLVSAVLSTVFAAVLLLVVAAPAAASTVFSFDYSLPGVGWTPIPVVASGTFTATDLDPINMQYTITGISGFWNGLAITSLLPPGGYVGNDNLLNASSPYLTLKGISFTVNGTGNFGNQVNVYYSGTGYTENSLDTGESLNFNLVQGQTPPSPVPEPATLGVAGAALAGWLILKQRRK